MQVLSTESPQAKTKVYKHVECGRTIEYGPDDVQSDREGRFVVCPCGAFISTVTLGWEAQQFWELDR
jgi:DNA-directed RNA polymerase subunit RPC12/RpoP